MNLYRYEKIDGREALRRLADGEKVMRETGSPYFINEEGRFVCDNAAIYRPHVTDLTLNEILKECDWYIPKPFDVRQAMIDRPNEWVGAFEVAENWYKVGFDTTFMQMACASISSEISIDLSEDRVFEVQLSNLINCIPIEDVPEEATR